MKKDKPLKLKPSARDKRRYLLIDEASEERIEKAILEYIGVLGFAKSAYMTVKTKDFPKKTVGSCLTKELKDVYSALVLAEIKVEKVSSTLKALKKK